MEQPDYPSHDETEEEIYVNVTVISLFLDMVARSLVAYESLSIPQIIAQVKTEYESDAEELGWPEDIVSQLTVLHANLSLYVQHHLGESSLGSLSS